MKKTYSFLLILFCLLSTSIGETKENSKSSSSEILLRGDLAKGKIRSLTSPIQAFITDHFIEVNFESTLGTIVVYIYDENESVVYQQSVNTNAVQQIFINISTFEEGGYLIEFVNSRDEYLLGYFEI